MGPQRRCGGAGLARLGDVHPPFMGSRPSHSSLRNAKSTGQRAVAFLARPDASHLILRESRVPMASTARVAKRISRRRRCSSTLARSVVHVVRLSTHEQMIRTNARRIVTTMADVQTIRDHPEMNLPRHTVGVQIGHVIVPPDCETPMAALISGACPRPTTLISANHSPETCDVRGRKLNVHPDLPSRGVSPRPSNAVRGLMPDRILR